MLPPPISSFVTVLPREGKNIITECSNMLTEKYRLLDYSRTFSVNCGGFFVANNVCPSTILGGVFHCRLAEWERFGNKMKGNTSLSNPINLPLFWDQRRTKTHLRMRINNDVMRRRRCYAYSTLLCTR